MQLAPPPAAKRPLTPASIAGRVLLALWGMIFLGLLAYLVHAFEADMLAAYLPRMIEGLGVTLKLVVISFLLGGVLSFGLVAMRFSRFALLRRFAGGFSYAFRGTPLLAQTFLVYYGSGSFRDELAALGLWAWFRDPFFCAVFAFTLNTAAYQSEILHGAIRSVYRGQVEAGRALGLPGHIIFVKIVLPQAMMVALRPYGNEIILLLKGSAIASVITVLDLMGETRRAYSRTFDFQLYLYAAVFYLMLVECLRLVWDRLERRLTRHLSR